MRVLMTATSGPSIAFVAGMPTDILHSQAFATEDEQIGRRLCLAVKTRLISKVYGTFLTLCILRVLEPSTISI